METIVMQNEIPWYLKWFVKKELSGTRYDSLNEYRTNHQDTDFHIIRDLTILRIVQEQMTVAANSFQTAKEPAYTLVIGDETGQISIKSGPEYSVHIYPYARNRRLDPETWSQISTARESDKIHIAFFEYSDHLWLEGMQNITLEERLHDLTS